MSSRTTLSNLKFDTPGGYSGYKKLNMLQNLVKSQEFRIVSSIAGIALATILIYNTYLSIKINKRELKKIEEEKEVEKEQAA